MAEQLNSVNVMCNLGKDPELRHTQSGTPVADLWVAIGGRKVNDEEQTTWIGMTAWGKTAELMADRLTKGSRIVVTGRLQGNEWTAQDGTKRRDIKIVVDRFYFADGPKNGNGGGQRQGGDLPTDERSWDPQPATSSDPEIPF